MSIKDKATTKKPTTRKTTTKKPATKKEDGRGGSRIQNAGMLSQLKEVTSEGKAYVVMYKYAGFRNDLSFEELCQKYIPSTCIDTIEKYEMEATYQEAVKLCLKLQHNQKMTELYNLYFDKAKEDVQSAKFFIDFSKQFFEQDAEGELTKLIKNIDLGDMNE